MRRLAVIAALAVALTACGSGGGPAILRATRPPTTRPSTCVAGPRPDLTCTPGTTNPAVTQATIHQTICVKGWTSTIRPPVSVTSKIKSERMRAYGYAGQSPSLFELDHLISLELGGGTADVGNLWPEPYAGAQGARIKDRVENLLKARVCAGVLTLADAQHQIVTDWTAVH